MGLQAKILQEYELVFGKRTFQQISDHTGIQITRVFRLYNGSLMRLDEYERFRRLIDQNRHCEQTDSLINNVDWEGRKQIELLISRYLLKKKLTADVG